MLGNRTAVMTYNDSASTPEPTAIARKNVKVLVAAQAILGSQMPISFVLGGLAWSIFVNEPMLGNFTNCTDRFWVNADSTCYVVDHAKFRPTHWLCCWCFGWSYRGQPCRDSALAPLLPAISTWVVVYRRLHVIAGIFQVRGH